MTNGTETVRDTLGRSLRSLRLSVIDRCDLRCNYCMPEEKYVWLPRQEILSFEDIERLVRTFTGLGVSRLRLTGGEPLLRRDIVDLVGRVSAVPGIEDVALTTNATQLASLATDLQEAGLHRVTVSLDSLRPERFKELTRRDELERVVAGIRAAGLVAVGVEGGDRARGVEARLDRRRTRQGRPAGVDGTRRHVHRGPLCAAACHPHHTGRRTGCAAAGVGRC